MELILLSILMMQFFDGDKILEFVLYFCCKGQGFDELILVVVFSFVHEITDLITYMTIISRECSTDRSFLFFLFLLHDYRAFLIFLPLYTNVHKVIVLIFFLCACGSNLGSDCRPRQLVYPNAPLKLFASKVVQPAFGITERNHYIDTVGSKNAVNFGKHFTGIGIRAFTALN